MCRRHMQSLLGFRETPARLCTTDEATAETESVIILDKHELRDKGEGNILLLVLSRLPLPRCEFDQVFMTVHS